MSTNVRELEDNMKGCMKECSQMGQKQENDKDIQKIFGKEIYECKVECLQKNTEIMKAIEKEMDESFFANKYDLLNIQ